MAFVPSFQDEDRDFSLVKDAMDGYLSLERNNVLDLNDSILSLAKDNDPLLIFNQMQNYMTELLKTNLQNRIIKIKLLHDINSVEKAKRELKLTMNIQTIVEILCFDLIL